MVVGTATLTLGAPPETTLETPPIPEAGPLGRRLFFDGRLSADGSVACSTCHDPARAFTDEKPTSIGIKGRLGQRNAPTILNAFRGVFGHPPNGPDLVRAIASYERTQVSFDSPFDHFIAGDEKAIDDSAKRGWELFK